MFEGELVRLRAHSLEMSTYKQGQKPGDIGIVLAITSHTDPDQQAKYQKVVRVFWFNTRRDCTICAYYLDPYEV